MKVLNLTLSFFYKNYVYYEYIKLTRNRNVVNYYVYFVVSTINKLKKSDDVVHVSILVILNSIVL